MAPAGSPKACLHPSRPKEHPLAGRRVVRNSDLPSGVPVYVVDWAERVSGPWAKHTDKVLVREGGRLFRVVNPDDLPSYDPVAVGIVS